MDMTRAYFVHSEEIERYHYPPECPFKTERAAQTRSVLSSMGYPLGVALPPPPAPVEALLHYHSQRYLEVLEAASGGELEAEGLFMGLATPETPVFTDLYPYARMAVGGSLAAAERVLDGSADVVFNPSGGLHHALSEKAGGFCYLNDIVLACRHLADAGARVACVDLDAHHGNGQQDAFFDTDAVLAISTHEDGRTLYPWGGFVEETGSGSGTGYTVNVPLPAGTDDECFVHAFNAVVPPLLQAYAPDVIVLEIGMDILATDPLTHLSMTNNMLTEVLPAITGMGVPILATGGGGYQPDNTARGWALAWTVLCDIDTETDMYVGMGGTFLGSSEWSAGLRDMRSYQHVSEKKAILASIDRTVEYLREHVFPVHGL